eukprot:PLAT4345.3.p1 GENE.PLAT4345.3~~PLAT4345.3.p1  ORF type:complete len:997 (+),score=330.00 PLAT4345.3:87-3077(+)
MRPAPTPASLRGLASPPAVHGRPMARMQPVSDGATAAVRMPGFAVARPASRAPSGHTAAAGAAPAGDVLAAMESGALSLLEGVSTIARIATDDGKRVALLKTRGMQRLMKLVSPLTLEDPTERLRIAEALLALLAKDKDAATVARKAGVIVFLERAIAMERLPAALAVLFDCAARLGMTDGGCASLAASRLPQLAVDSISAFIDEQKMLRTACALLARVSRLPGSPTLDRLAIGMAALSALRSAAMAMPSTAERALAVIAALVSSSRAERKPLADAGAVDCALDAISSFPSALSVQRRGLIALFFMSKAEENRAAICTPRCAEVALACMARAEAAGMIDAVFFGVGVLCCLAASLEVAVVMVAADAPAMLLRAAQQPSAKADMVGRCLLALSRLVSNTDGSSFLSDSTLTVMKDVLAAYPSHLGILDGALRLLHCFAEAADVRSLVSAGFLDTVTATLATTPRSPAVAEAALLALAPFLAHSSDLPLSIFTASLVSSIINCMQAHTAVEGVQWYGCACLLYVSRDENGARFVSASAQAVGTVVLTALQEHSDCQLLHAYGCAVVFYVVNTAADEGAISDALLQMGILSVLSASMRRFPDLVSVQDWVTLALLQLCSTSRDVTVAVEALGVAALVKGNMQRHADHPGLQTFSPQLLELLDRVSAASAATAATAAAPAAPVVEEEAKMDSLLPGGGGAGGAGGGRSRAGGRADLRKSAMYMSFSLTSAMTARGGSGRRSRGTAPVDPLIPFSHIEHGACIADGAHGPVYEGVYNAAEVVVKTVPLDEKQLQALNKRAPMLCRILHCNVAQFHGFTSDADAFYLVQQRAADSLASRLFSDAGLTAEEKAVVVQTTCAGLRALHADGSVHRDLRPENIMLDATGRALLNDYGLHGIVPLACDRGLPHYTSPEQLSGTAGENDSGPDIYSLGLVIYALATSCVPFADLTAEEIAARAGELKPDVSSLKPALAEIILSCVDADPTMRPSAVAVSGLITTDLF